jgi:dipeptidyl aminopeptidase/acylaminoacyl peptidase
MMAWSPEGDRLAYVGPVNSRWGWYTGNLTLLSLETGETRATRDIKVAGDLTWSPDGERIAMRALLGTENSYTVLVLQTSDFSTLDLFPAGAGTDEFASEKGIIEWTDTSRIQVAVSCGVDCTRVVEINLVGQQQRLISEGRWQDDHSLEVVLNQIGVTINPKWLMANASPDRALIFYVDQNGQAWLASPESGTKYRLELDLGEVQESKWSPDSRLLAVRTNEMIFLYDLECSLNWSE